MKLSVLIPSRNETFLNNTIADILKNFTGEFEILAVLDGVWPAQLPVEDERVTLIHHGKPLGMRACINHAASVAKGDYLLKTDAHCMFDYGLDEVLLRDIDDNWIVIPRRERLDADNWTRQEVGKPPIDYHFLSCPITNKDGYSMHGDKDNARSRRLSHIPIDETMSFQGSFWLMSRKHWDSIGGMPEEFYGGFTQEPQQIGMKTWLGGGKVMVNKNTTYYHLHKGAKHGRGYYQDREEIKRGHFLSAVYWMSNKWEKRIHDIEWFIDRFWPVPTWPENWQDIRFQDVTGKIVV